MTGTDIESDAGVVGVATLANRPLDMILTFDALTDAVPLADLDRILAAGATPVITIEPWDPTAGVDQPEFALRRIADGAFDADLRRWAEDLSRWGHPAIIRFAHEMNGDWYPWGISVNGNSAEDYRNAWRHMHDILSTADGLTFLWAPMTEVAGIGAFTDAFPGAEFVDHLGVDGYNWGDDGVHAWASPEYIFADSLRQLRELDDDLPILLAEIGSAEDSDPQRKSRWITEFLSLATTSDRVEGFLWFQTNKERDWRFNSSPQSALAFRSGLAEIPDPS